MTADQTSKRRRVLAVYGCVIASMVLTSVPASAHVKPWRDGVSRLTGYGTCAKGPCLKRIDFSPSVPHVHLTVDGRSGVAVCTGLGRKPPACTVAAINH